MLSVLPPLLGTPDPNAAAGERLPDLGQLEAQGEVLFPQQIAEADGDAIRAFNFTPPREEITPSSVAHAVLPKELFLARCADSKRERARCNALLWREGIAR